MRRYGVLFLALAGLVALLAAPATEAAKKKSKSPSIKLVSPMRVEVGKNLTLRGKNFSAKKRRNTVVFRGPSGRSVLVKPSRASKKKLVVRVPSDVEELLSERDGNAVATRLKIRVLAGKFSKYTSRRLSPVVVSAEAPSPKPAPKPPARKPSAPSTPKPVTPASCRTGGDSDGDLLTDAQEDVIKTNACDRDSDNDTIEDGFEYKSAVDLNDDEFQDPNESLPYPGKRPYPNPLDPTDRDLDHDGDSLTLLEEQALWTLSIQQGAVRTLSPLAYSAGEQYSAMARGSDGRRTPNLAAAGYERQTNFLNWASIRGYRTILLSDGPPWYDHSPPESNLYGILDFNRNGAESPTAPAGYFRTETTYYDFDRDSWLSDDERDQDADGLTNYDEAHGRLTAAYWEACYGGETPYYLDYAPVSMIDGDTDGDGVRDGADDQDHDDIPNVMEMSRNAASGLDDTGPRGCEPAEGLPAPPDTNHPSAYGRVNPFNPCLPAVWSRTCTRHPEFGNGGGAPFDDSPNWYSLN